MPSKSTKKPSIKKQASVARMRKALRVLDLVEKFAIEHEVTCPESIYQQDSTNIACSDLVCEIFESAQCYRNLSDETFEITGWKEPYAAD